MNFNVTSIRTQDQLMSILSMDIKDTFNECLKILING